MQFSGRRPDGLYSAAATISTEMGLWRPATGCYNLSFDHTTGGQAGWFPPITSYIANEPENKPIIPAQPIIINVAINKSRSRSDLR